MVRNRLILLAYHWLHGELPPRKVLYKKLKGRKVNLKSTSFISQASEVNQAFPFAT